MNEAALRERIALHGRSLFERGYACGTAGNISARLEDGFLMTPTNSCLGRLDPARISKIDFDGRHVSGDAPSKEVALHLAVYAARPDDGAVAHLHSTSAVAVACLTRVDPADTLPPLTPYFVMRVGRVPLVPYYPPGDAALAAAVGEAAREACAMLLANHGSVVSARDLDGAVCGSEELEETARLSLLLRGSGARMLTPEQVEVLTRRFRR
jgi:3-dehydro-4-phosphotetronate decarboxylase